MKKKKKEAFRLSRTPWPFDFPVLPDHLELPDYHNHPDRTLSTTLTSSNTQTSLQNPITLTTPATSDNLATLANPSIQTSAAPIFQRESVLTGFPTTECVENPLLSNESPFWRFIELKIFIETGFHCAQ